MKVRELTVRSGDLSLAGSMWLPSMPAAGTVLMYPGSGPSDRDNDVYFPPIRQHLLGAGVAVCSFDKRGIGGSTGRWQEAGILEQADDVLACLAALSSDHVVPKPVGLFGHSQGGWVVIEAAGRVPEIAFVAANSGPGVTPGRQERYAHSKYLAARGVTAAEMPQALEPYDELMGALRRGGVFRAARKQFAMGQLPDVYRRRELILFPDNEEFWDFLQLVFDYEPRLALERIRVPVLALFGAEDPLVPVNESAAVYREAVRPELLTLEVFPGADHRIQTGEPPAFADRYFETLASFVADAIT